MLSDGVRNAREVCGRPVAAASRADASAYVRGGPSDAVEPAVDGFSDGVVALDGHATDGWIGPGTGVEAPSEGSDDAPAAEVLGWVGWSGGAGERSCRSDCSPTAHHDRSDDHEPRSAHDHENAPRSGQRLGARVVRGRRGSRRRPGPSAAAAAMNNDHDGGHRRAPPARHACAPARSDTEIALVKEDRSRSDRLPDRSERGAGPPRRRTARHRPSTSVVSRCREPDAGPRTWRGLRSGWRSRQLPGGPRRGAVAHQGRHHLPTHPGHLRGRVSDPITDRRQQVQLGLEGQHHRPRPTADTTASARAGLGGSDRAPQATPPNRGGGPASRRRPARATSRSRAVGSSRGRRHRPGPLPRGRCCGGADSPRRRSTSPGSSSSTRSSSGAHRPEEPVGLRAQLAGGGAGTQVVGPGGPEQRALPQPGGQHAEVAAGSLEPLVQRLTRPAGRGHRRSPRARRRRRAGRGRVTRRSRRTTESTPSQPTTRS